MMISKDLNHFHGLDDFIAFSGQFGAVKYGSFAC
jgi:hypothetical protein